MLEAREAHFQTILHVAKSVTPLGGIADRADRAFFLREHCPHLAARRREPPGKFWHLAGV